MPRHSTLASAVVIAFSYIRFSSAEQRQGDSLRRQTKAAEDWCARNHVRLDESTTYHDLGKSAFLGDHRKNPDRYALAAFLKMAENGKIPKGSYLIVENLDRLTREHMRAAVTLFLSLLELGINIVTTTPERVFRHDSNDMTDIIIAVVELSRGHSESAIKSERVGAAWAEKKALARQGKPQPAKGDRVNNMMLLTHRLPAWIRERNGRLELIPEKAALVRRIFQLAAHGYGSRLIAQTFSREGVPALGPCGHWNASYLRTILADRRVLGVHQPRRKRGRAKDGEPIPHYYPAAVTEAEWLAARAGAAERRTNGRGRTTIAQGAAPVNLFAGLLKDALTGASYNYEPRPSRPPAQDRPPTRVLTSASAREGRAREGRGATRSFPYATFEAAILSCLREIDPHEILNGGQRPDQTLILAGQLEAIETELVETAVFMEQHGFSVTIGKRITELERQKQDLVEQLQEARQKAAFPLSEVWGSVQTLAETLAKAADPMDARLRLRSALRRIISGIWIVVVPRGHNRLCEAQVWFAGGERYRSYFIIHRPPRSNGAKRVPGRWFVNAITHPEALRLGVPCGSEDLRDPDVAHGFKDFFLAYPMDLIDQLLAERGQELP
jgi:DNA invertase Pin-like site-specific DNA recombinase